MDQLLSSIIKTHRIGDSFNWWVGQVEETTSESSDNKGGYRLKVRIVGDHPQSKDILDTSDLPWAQVMMPVNVPFMPGNIGGANHQLIKGCWVVGFYFDTDKQKPIVMGSIGQTPSATIKANQSTPGSNNGFENTVSSDVNPSYPPTDGTPGNGEQPNTVTGSLPDGSKNANGESKVSTPERKRQAMLDEKWCQTVAEKCDKPDIKEQMTMIIGEMLADIQRNNGNIGSYLVNQANGKISDVVGIGRKYTSKSQKVLREFIARVKGFVIQKITAGVKDLIKMLIAPSDTGNILTPVTEWFNRMLKDLGCKMEDLGKRLEKWLTNVIMSYITQIYQNAACLLDTLVNGILSQFNSLMEEMLGTILGPLQDILGVVGSALNLLGGAVNFVLQLLGISCSGPSSDCAKYKKICNTGEKEKRDDDEEDFLDKLLEDIDNLFPVTTGDYTQYTCPPAYEGNSLEITDVGFTGGVPLGPEEPGQSIPPGSASKKKKVSYDIDDIFVEEGNEAVFTVTRSGYIAEASSVTFKTLSNKGTATKDVDYLPVNDILGFAPGEDQKRITVKTFFSSEQEPNEDFFIKMNINSPIGDPDIESSFIKNVAKCTITEGQVTDPLNPKPVIGEVNPITGIAETFPPVEGEVPEEGQSGGGGENTPIGDTDDTTDSEVTFRVAADRSSVKEGEFVKYSITTTNVVNGAILRYTLTGAGITSDDLIGTEIRGTFVINNNTSSVTVGLAEDGVVEDEEVLRFTIDTTGAFADVLVISDDTAGNDDPSDFDEGEGETPENTYDEFRPPTVDPGKVITDPDGGIIEIPIDDPGDPWAEPPFVFIGGEGVGAIATPLLDERGFITEIRVKSPGYGYKLNLASDNNVRCIIDTFTIISPGQGYTSKPDVYVNGKLGIAEAIINDDGFVIGARVLDRSLTFEELPKIIVVGGGGYGSTMIPSLVCRETEKLAVLGATKIGTGRYVDCP